MNNDTFMDYDDEIIREQNLRRTVKLIFCFIYGILFGLGTIGNGIVIVMICNVITSINKNRRRHGKLSGITTSNTNHVFIYVLGLSIVDFLVILHLPFLIFEMVEGQWIFGTFMCKLYWYGESVNKLLSSFLMTVLSWDRYLAVCSPFKSFKFRTNKVALLVLLSCSIFATLLLYPVLKESTVLKINKLTGERLFDDTMELLESDNHGFTISKCIFDTSSPIFMLYTFFIGYVIPAVLITFFYVNVIIKLRNTIRKSSAQSASASQNDRLNTVTQRIVAVVLFYFFCWTPYWTLNIMSQFSLIVVSWSTLTLSSIFFAAHILVCFNSAANPVLYALINRELRQQHLKALMKKRQSVHVATHVAMDFIEKYSQRLICMYKNTPSSSFAHLSPPINVTSRTIIPFRMGPSGGRFSVTSVDAQFRYFEERPDTLAIKKSTTMYALDKPVPDKRSASFSHPFSPSTDTTTPGDNKDSMQNSIQTSIEISDTRNLSNSALNDLFL